jgi:hypothetical protein
MRSWLSVKVEAGEGLRKTGLLEKKSVTMKGATQKPVLDIFLPDKRLILVN